MATIRNPMEWGAAQLKLAAQHTASVSRSMRGTEADRIPSSVRRITVADLRDVLRKGLDDFGASRTDVIVLCIVYPIIGIILARLAFGYDMLPLLFPLASGFALLGPAAAVGLYEMSRRREQGAEPTWADALGTVRSPRFGTIVALSLVLLAIFVVWLLAAQVIYALTLGPEPPASVGAFLGDVFGTGAGWTMIIIGIGVGAIFAALVLAISVVSFPLLLDHDVGLRVAVMTSVNAVLENPGPMAAWGLIVAAGLVLGSIPAFLGLAVVIPVLGHATWHLYRKVVPN